MYKHYYALDFQALGNFDHTGFQLNVGLINYLRFIFPVKFYLWEKFQNFHW